MRKSGLTRGKTWMVSNAVAEQDAAGNIKWAKNKSTGRIDGVVALTMALGLAMEHLDSVYESSGMAVLGDKHGESPQPEPAAAAVAFGDDDDDRW